MTTGTISVNEHVDEVALLLSLYRNIEESRTISDQIAGQIALQREELDRIKGLIEMARQSAYAKRMGTPDFDQNATPEQVYMEVMVLFGVAVDEISSGGRDSRLTAARAYATHRLREAGRSFDEIDNFLGKKKGSSAGYLYTYGADFWQKYIVRNVGEESAAIAAVNAGLGRPLPEEPGLD